MGGKKKRLPNQPEICYVKRYKKGADKTKAARFELYRITPEQRAGFEDIRRRAEVLQRTAGTKGEEKELDNLINEYEETVQHNRPEYLKPQNLEFVLARGGGRRMPTPEEQKTNCAKTVGDHIDRIAQMETTKERREIERETAQTLKEFFDLRNSVPELSAAAACFDQQEALKEDLRSANLMNFDSMNRPIQNRVSRDPRAMREQRRVVAKHREYLTTFAGGYPAQRQRPTKPYRSGPDDIRCEDCAGTGNLACERMECQLCNQKNRESCPQGVKCKYCSGTGVDRKLAAHLVEMARGGTEEKSK